MDKRVILINPPMSPLEENLYIPLHYMSLGAVAEKEGYTVEIIDFDFIFKSQKLEPNLPFIIERLSEIHCDGKTIFGLTAYGHNVWIASEMGRKTRELYPDSILLMGGPEATFSAEALLKSADFDAVVHGEGEETFRDILRAIKDEKSFSNILGITYKKNGEIIVNADRPQIADLDQLPVPAYHLIDVATYTEHPNFVKFHIEAGRGCPFICTFCSTSLVWKRKYRVKSVERLLKEVKEVQSRFGWDKFDFVHDNLVFKKEYIHGLCEEIQNQNLNIGWSCTSRSDHIEKSTIQAMHDAGCTSIFFGVESGSWERQRQIRKRIKPEQTLKTIEHCAEIGMGATASFILGYPNESETELNETLEFAHLLKIEGATVVQAPVLHPHTGTDLYKEQYPVLKFSNLVNQEHALSLHLIPTVAQAETQKDLYTFSLSFRSSDDDRFYYHLRSVFLVLMECYPLTLSLMLSERKISLLSFLNHFISLIPKDSSLLELTPLLRRDKIISLFSDIFCSEALLVNNIFKYEDAWRKVKSSGGSVFERFDYDLASLIDHAQNGGAQAPEERINYILFKTEGEEGIAGEIDETTFKICTWISDRNDHGVNAEELDSLRFSLNKEKGELDQVIQSLCEEGILISHRQPSKEDKICLR